jgi:dolichol-phosphate mannosyltransferase
MSNRLVIIPTYNEKENVEAIIRAVFSLKKPFSVLVVDDNSPDGTHAIVRNLQQEFPDKLYLEVREQKEGLGKAYIHGFKWALARTFDHIFEMDADFSHNPEDLIRLDKACELGADLAIGSRYVRGINVVNWPLKRVLLSLGASVYVKIITGMRVQDPTAGFVCYHRRVLEAIDLDQVKFVGYAFQIEMKFKAYKKKFKIKEVSIVFKDREKGYSKMSSSIIKEGIWGVIKLKFNSIFNKKNF